MKTPRIAFVEMFVRELERSRVLYEEILRPLGIEITYMDERVVVFAERFWLRESSDATENAEIGFTAPTPEAVQDFHRAGVAMGARILEKPTLRSGRFSAALEDPDANVIEAVYRLSGDPTARD